MSINKPYLTILICSITSFTLILSVYAFIEGHKPLNRIGFAVFMSTVPAVVTRGRASDAKAAITVDDRGCLLHLIYSNSRDVGHSSRLGESSVR